MDATFLADLPAAPVRAGSVSDGLAPPVAHAPGTDGRRSPSVPPDLMRQIEDAIKAPPLALPKAVNGRR